MLVSVALPGDTDESVDASLDELELFVDTAGADVAARLVQRRSSPDHTWYIGKGKVDELKEICLAVDADTVVFDNDRHRPNSSTWKRRWGAPRSTAPP